MSTVHTSVSDMLVTVKTREIQRGLLAEMRGDQPAASRHLLAAAHLEFVLAQDYVQNGQTELSRRSRISAASCLWRAGQYERAQQEFDSIIHAVPSQEASVRAIVADLETKFPKPS